MPVRVLLVGDGVALHALPDGIDSRAEPLRSLLDANTRSGRMSCRVLSLSHEGDTRPLGPGPKAPEGRQAPPRLL
jgi:hypothetical protein